MIERILGLVLFVSIGIFVMGVYTGFVWLLVLVKESHDRIKRIEKKLFPDDPAEKGEE